MEQQRLSAYLRLIQDLLSCPSGEEWIHLKQHEVLVDAQFVQVMEQVAAQLDKQHSPEAAIFLHNWAAKLHHIFFKEVPSPSPEEDPTEAYLAFIDKLLSCPEGTEDDLIAAHKTLIGPGLVHKMREVAWQLREQEEIATALSLEKFASQLNQLWTSEHNFQPQIHKRPAPTPKMPTATTVADGSRAERTSAERTSDKEAVVRNFMNAPSAPDDSTQVEQPSLEMPISAAPAPSGYLDDETEDPWETQSAEEVPASAVEHRNGFVENRTSDEPGAAIASPAYGEIAQGLNAIAAALQQLNQTLSPGEPPSSSTSQHHTRAEARPLAHLEALEKAHNANWQLTTDEVEKLIGVRPRCHEKETVYERGNWRFTKVGHLGNQTAWQVSKTST